MILDTEGEFLVTMLNVNMQNTELTCKQLIGNNTDEFGTHTLNNPSCVIDKCEFGDNLMEVEKIEMMNLLNEFRDTFAKNAKKRQTTDIIEHRILTADS